MEEEEKKTQHKILRKWLETYENNHVARVKKGSIGEQCLANS